MSRLAPVPVAPDVYRLGDRRVNWWLVVEAGAATVVDAGLPGQYHQLPALLAHLRLRLSAIKAVVVTHGHIDHMGCAPRLQGGVGAAVHVGRDDLPMVGRRPKLDLGVVAHSLRPAALRSALSYARQGVLGAGPVVGASALDDEQVIDVPGRPRFLHAPGHTRGSGMFLLEGRGVLFSGDVLVTLDPFSDRTGPRTLPPFDNVDHAMAVRALGRVEASGAAVVLPGHGEAWTAGATEAAVRARAVS